MNTHKQEYFARLYDIFYRIDNYMLRREILLDMMIRYLHINNSPLINYINREHIKNCKIKNAIKDSTEYPQIGETNILLDY